MAETRHDRIRAGYSGAGAALRERLNAVIQGHGVPAQATGMGSMTVVHFHGGPLRSPADAAGADKRARTLLHLASLSG